MLCSQSSTEVSAPKKNPDSDSEEEKVEEKDREEEKKPESTYFRALKFQ